MFLAGSVFQLSSLGFTALLLVLLLLYARDFGAAGEDLRFYGGFLGVSLLCGAAGLRFWRELQVGVHIEPVTIAPFQRVG